MVGVEIEIPVKKQPKVCGRKSSGFSRHCTVELKDSPKVSCYSNRHNERLKRTFHLGVLLEPRIFTTFAAFVRGLIDRNSVTYPVGNVHNI